MRGGAACKMTIESSPAMRINWRRRRAYSFGLIKLLLPHVLPAALRRIPQ
jgi:hypothetical protein